MGLRAGVTQRALWQRRIIYYYEGTYLATELDGVGTWFVFDTRDPSMKVAGPFFELGQAKASAERLVATDLALYQLPRST